MYSAYNIQHTPCNAGMLHNICCMLYAVCCIYCACTVCALCRSLLPCLAPVPPTQVPCPSLSSPPPVQGETMSDTLPHLTQLGDLSANGNPIARCCIAPGCMLTPYAPPIRSPPHAFPCPCAGSRSTARTPSCAATPWRYWTVGRWGRARAMQGWSHALRASRGSTGAFSLASRTVPLPALPSLCSPPAPSLRAILRWCDGR